VVGVVSSGAICAAALCVTVWMRSPCGALGEDTKRRLVNYVEQALNIPPGDSIHITKSSLVGSTCYRKIEFESDNPTRRVHLSLFASPDLRFLSHDVLDTHIQASDSRRRGLGVPQPKADKMPVIGTADAPITITVFSDFECPYCAKFASMMRNIVLPSKGQRVRFVFRNFPIGADRTPRG